MKKMNAAKKSIDKDYDKLLGKLSQSMIYQRSIIKDQEKLLTMIEDKRSKLAIERDEIMKSLTPYMGTKEVDSLYYDLKKKYIECLRGIDSLNKSMTICEESITEAKLAMDRG